jgi:hypothetical protein
MKVPSFHPQDILTDLFFKQENEFSPAFSSNSMKCGWFATEHSSWVYEI